MEKFVITGGKPLHGEVTISGAKNAAVGILPATILAAYVCVIENLPDISDVAVSLKILSTLGAGIILNDRTTSEIYTAPATRFVADFIGESNILPATAAAVRGDTCVYTTPMGQVLGAAAHVSEGETVYLCVRPEAVCVSAEPVSGFGIQITVTDNICTGNLIKSIGVDADGHELRFSRLAGADGFSCGEAHRRQQEHDKCSDDMFFHWMIRI